jgi:branched-subunit amino acid transport protein
MIEFMKFLPYLLIMAIVTYLVRMLPLVFFKKKIQNKFVLSFLYYMPYTVLAVMTIPEVFYSTSSPISATVGVAVAIVLAYFKLGLLRVAVGASAAVLVAEVVMTYLI